MTHPMLRRGGPASFRLLLGFFLVLLTTSGARAQATSGAHGGTAPAGAAPGSGTAAADPASGDGTAPDDGAPADVAADFSRFMSLAEADLDGPRGVRVREPDAFDGYTLYAPLNSHTVYLVDMSGEVVHTWPTDSAPGAWVYLLDDGTLLRSGREDDDPRFAGGGIGGRIQTLAPDGSVLWHWQLAGEDRQQHHDLEPLPNGNVLVIAWERMSARDAVRLGRDPRHVDRERGFWPDVLLEVRPLPPDGAEIVWEWRAADHLVQDTDPRLPGYGAIDEHPGLIDINADFRHEPDATEEEQAEQDALDDQMRALGYVGGAEEEDDDDGAGADEEDHPGDWLHTNAVAYHPGHDLIALSSPHLCEVWVIDHGTTTAEAAGHTGGRRGRGGDLLWRWGNPVNHGAGTLADRQLFYQHDPKWIDGERPGELRLLVFNNGRGRADGDYSSVDELVLPFDPERGLVCEPGRPCAPAAPAWRYTDADGFYSAFISGVQRLPNGNTLVTSGAPGRIFEVTRDGHVVWDYRNPHGGDVEPPEHAGKAPPLALFRATRLPPDHPGVVALLGR